MKTLLLLATTLLSVISANRVIHLNADNFDAIVDGTRNVFVKFEASWCGPCKRMTPIMDSVAAEAFPNLDGETILASIDADAEREIGERFEIEAFPTIKLFLKGRELDEAIEFQGDRNPENISRFIKTHVSMNEKALPLELKQLRPQIPLTQLLNELAQVAQKPKALPNGIINFNNFATGFMDDTDNDGSEAHYKVAKPAQQQQKNLKQKKIKNRKDRTRSRKSRADLNQADELTLVDSEEAKSIIKSAGSKPVVLIFFSPSKP